MTACATCQTDHSGCAGHSRAGTPCKNAPMAGQRVCRMHGGAAPQAKAAAERRLAEEAALREVRTLGLPVDISPTDALLEEVRWTSGHVQWLRSKVQELDDQNLVWGVTRTETEAGASLEIGIDSDGVTDIGAAPANKVIQTAAPSLWYELYAREREHLVKVCAAAIRAGVEERKVRLAEQQGDLVGLAIRKILDGLYAAMLAAGMDATLHAAWAASVSQIVPRELRAIAGGSTG